MFLVFCRTNLRITEEQSSVIDPERTRRCEEMQEITVQPTDVVINNPNIRPIDAVERNPSLEVSSESMKKGNDTTIGIA